MIVNLRPEYKDNYSIYKNSKQFTKLIEYAIFIGNRI